MISHITAIETLAIILLLLATLMSFYRLLFGPSNADRVISADALSLIASVFLVVLALLFDSILYLDIALIYAVLSFVGIIALAKVIETGKSRGEN
ncbi:MAG: monovalent cation/H+ antiporter complex subunit F [Pseudomonadota bacterium]